MEAQSATNLGAPHGADKAEIHGSGSDVLPEAGGGIEKFDAFVETGSHTSISARPELAKKAHSGGLPYPFPRTNPRKAASAERSFGRPDMVQKRRHSASKA